VGWYLKEHNNNGIFRKLFNQLGTAHEQRQAVADLFNSSLEVTFNTKEIAA